MDAGTRAALPDLESEQLSSTLQQQAQHRAQCFLQTLTDQSIRQREGRPTFDSTALQGLHNISSEGPGHCMCHFHVDADHCNRGGTLHGGCTATLIDTVGSAALATISDRPCTPSHI